MTALSAQLLANARFEANQTRLEPGAKQSDEILAIFAASLLEDTGRVLPGVTPGFLRLPPRHEVRPAKEHRPAIDALPGEKG